MTTQDTVLPLHEERLLALEHHCREMLAGRINGCAANSNDASSSNGHLEAERARKLLNITARVFPPGILEVTRERDPDNPKIEYLVVEVVVSGDYKDTNRRKHEWHDAVAALFGEEATRLSLIAYPQ
jgi:hypothetical protein